MRRTIDLDDDLMRSIERHTAASGRTPASWIERTLRDQLAREQHPAEPFELNLTVAPWGAQTGVDLTSRQHILDRMDESS